MQVVYKFTTKKNSKRGFSLSELLISIGLMAFVGVAAIGGIVVLVRARETIDRQNKAEMIMIATVSYLRNDLNGCSDPHPQTMDCVDNAQNINIFTASSFGADFFMVDYSKFDPSEKRYTSVIIQNKNFTKLGTTMGFTTCVPQKVQYWNSNANNNYSGTNDPNYAGIGFGIIYSDVANPTALQGSISDSIFKAKEYKLRKYIIAQNVMQGTGMYSQIGGNGKINYNETEKYFYFTVEVVDANNPEDVILSQEVIVCPDTQMP